MIRVKALHPWCKHAVFVCKGGGERITTKDIKEVK